MQIFISALAVLAFLREQGTGEFTAALTAVREHFYSTVSAVSSWLHILHTVQMCFVMEKVGVGLVLQEGNAATLTLLCAIYCALLCNLEAVIVKIMELGNAVRMF